VAEKPIKLIHYHFYSDKFNRYVGQSSILGINPNAAAQTHESRASMGSSGASGGQAAFCPISKFAIISRAFTMAE